MSEYSQFTSLIITIVALYAALFFAVYRVLNRHCREIEGWRSRT